MLTGTWWSKYGKFHGQAFRQRMYLLLKLRSNLKAFYTSSDEGGTTFGKELYLAFIFTKLTSFWTCSF